MDEPKVKRVGRSMPPDDPVECRRRALRLQEHADRINPWPRPRGFVFRARTWADYEAWRKAQSNPRLW